MTTFIIVMAIFYAAIIMFCIIVDIKLNRTMGVDSKGELVWMKKKDIQRLKQEQDYIYH